jgi:tetratricopeptide (TPR) repeat protein
MLSRAERHLVRAHREELALILYHGCQGALLEQPTFNTFFCRKQSPHGEVKFADPADWRSRAARELPWASRISAAAEAAIEEVLAESNEPERASRLAMASLNLLPRDETRIWLGLSLFQGGAWSVARTAFHEVLRGRPSIANEALAHLNLGSCAFRVGDWSTAREHYALATRVDGVMVPALIFFMSSSILLGEVQDAFDASRRLEDVMPQHHPLLGECAQVIRTYTPGIVNKESAYNRTLSLLWDDLSPAAHEALGGIVH